MMFTWIGGKPVEHEVIREQDLKVLIPVVFPW